MRHLSSMRNHLVTKATLKALECKNRFQVAVCNKRGSQLLEYGVLIAIACVIGGVMMVGINALVKNTVLKDLTTDVQNLFNYSSDS